MDLKTVAEKSHALESELGITFDDVLHKLTQELGEFNDAVQNYRGRYCKQKAENTDMIISELGDLILNLVSVCNKVGIDPNEFSKFAETTLDKFHSRKELYKKSMEDTTLL